MGVASEAAMKPLRGQLEATSVPMQRAIESLQAEFIAMRELETTTCRMPRRPIWLWLCGTQSEPTQRHGSHANARHKTEVDWFGLVNLTGAAPCGTGARTRLQLR